MEQIVLNTNLRFLLKTLSAEERGNLLTALMEDEEQSLTDKALNIYHYIVSLQEEKANLKRKMKELSKLAVAAKKRVAEEKELDLFDQKQPTVTADEPRVSKRKVTKEKNNINKIKKIFISVDEKTNESVADRLIDTPFVKPTIDEVKEFIAKENLAVEAETFMDFYDSHGWCVGKTPIKSWRATLRLWHRRAVGYSLKESEVKKTLQKPEPKLEVMATKEMGSKALLLCENKVKDKPKGTAFKKTKEGQIKQPKEAEIKEPTPIFDNDPLRRFVKSQIREDETYFSARDSLATIGSMGAKNITSLESLKEHPKNPITMSKEKVDPPPDEACFNQSPFARFMQRIETNDILQETNK